MTKQWASSRARRTSFVLCGLLTILAAAPRAALALTPESPEVKACIAKGVAYLESCSPDTRLGARALIGLVLRKQGRDANHPRIAEAVKAIQENLSRKPVEIEDIYSVGISIIFLVELDPSAYRSEIEGLLKYLQSKQQPWGAWGYPSSATGDTSMTQYGVLSMWEASRVGIRTPVDSWEKVANWLLRTQDPSGAWGYQGKDPGNFNLEAQAEVRHSMAAAGLGSLYICVDQLGIGAAPGPADGVSPLLRRMEERNRSKMRSARVDASQVAKARAMGDEWMRKNYSVAPSQYRYYYLYAFERYQSFREALVGGPATPAQWYDDGARKLMAEQAADGSWAGENSGVPDTSFALLFLLRSSKKSLDKQRTLGDGTLVGGRGLPSAGEEVQVRLGQVRAKPLAGPASKLLSVIQDPRNPDFLRAVEGLDDLSTQATSPELSQQAARLRELAGGDSSTAKAAALRALGRTRNLDDAPVLIHGLSDPEPEVFAAAQEALRFMSRKFPPPGDGQPLDDSIRQEAIKYWTAWYRAVRPGAQFDSLGK